MASKINRFIFINAQVLSSAGVQNCVRNKTPRCESRIILKSCRYQSASKICHDDFSIKNMNKNFKSKN